VTSSSPRPGLRKTALWIAGLPLALAVAPLFVHTSAEPVLAGYSGRYLALLVALSGATAGLAWSVGARCERTGQLGAAYAVASVVFGLGGALTAAEVGLRQSPLNDTFANLKKFGHERSLLLGFETRASHDWELGGARFSTDARRFRSDPNDAGDGPPPAKQRLAVVGGSSAFGFGLNDDQTWPYLLERRLREQGHEVDVVNAANQGHNAFQTLVRTYLRVLPLRPDWVLFYGGRNDVDMTVLPPTGGHIDEQAMPWSTAAYLDRRFPGYTPYFRTLVAYLAYRTLAGPSSPDGLYPPPPPPGERVPPAEAVRANADQFARHLRTLIDACRRAGTEPILTTFLFDPGDNAGLGVAALSQQNNLLRQIAREEDVLLFDLARDFSGRPDKAAYFFEDEYHPSRLGAQYIAERLAEHSERLIDPR